MSFEKYIKEENQRLKRHVSKLLAGDYVLLSRAYIKKQFDTFSNEIPALLKAWSPKAETLLPSKSKDYAINKNQLQKFIQGVDDFVTKKFNELDPLPPMTHRQFNIADFINGFKSTVRDDANNTWECTITITQKAWKQIQGGGKSAGINQITGVLTQQNIWISDKSRIKGRRCIKPEPYGWIVSTGSSVRLVDVDTSIFLQHPKTLKFTKVMNVK